jgi:hypothetical protein
MKKLVLISSILLLFLSSCSEKIDGSSEEKFKASAEKIKTKLSPEEQNRFEVALRVITASAMKHKFDHPDEDKNKSFNEITLQMVNGKSYGDLVDMAEQYLAETHKLEIDGLKKDIADLAGRKAQEAALKKQLDMLKGTLVKIDLVNGEPTIFAEFKNLSKDTLYRFVCSVFLKTDSGKYLTSATSNSHTGKTSANGTVNPNDTFIATAEIGQLVMRDYPHVPWRTMKYPVKDLAQYHLIAGGMTKQLRMYEQEYDLSSVRWEYWDEENFVKMTNLIKKREAQKPTLDSLELSN